MAIQENREIKSIELFEPIDDMSYIEVKFTSNDKAYKAKIYEIFVNTEEDN